MDALTIHNANPGRSGHTRALRAAHILMDARETLRQSLNARDSNELTFAFNCTDALNCAIKGSLAAGDHVVTTCLEHNSVLRVLTGLEARLGVEATYLEPDPEGFVLPHRVRAACKANTRLVVITHASNVTGQIQPIAAIGSVLADTGISYLVDGAQALGVLPVDVGSIQCHLYAFPGHKGLLGPQGTGGLYIRSGTRLAPFREGGTGSLSESTAQPEELPDRYESGTMNLPGIAGLGAGAAYAQTHPVREKEARLTAQLMEGLRAIDGVTVYGSPDPRNRVGVVSLNVGDLASGSVADLLDRAGFQVRGGLHCAPYAHRYLGTLARGAVRASIGHTTTEAQIDAFLRAIYDIANQ